MKRFKVKLGLPTTYSTKIVEAENLTEALAQVLADCRRANRNAPNVQPVSLSIKEKWL